MEVQILSCAPRKNSSTRAVFTYHLAHHNEKSFALYEAPHSLFTWRGQGFLRRFRKMIFSCGSCS